MALLSGAAIVNFDTSENYVDIGGSLQFSCSIDIDTGPDYNNLHLSRSSGDGATCGMCDQAFLPTPPHGGIGPCIGDTDADYSIQCEWNPSSTVMTFTVTGLTAIEITDWTCTSRGDPGMIHSVTIREFGQFCIVNMNFV